jgi:hypothetical protein
MEKRKMEVIGTWFIVDLFDIWTLPVHGGEGSLLEFAIVG